MPAPFPRPQRSAVPPSPWAAPARAPLEHKGRRATAKDSRSASPDPVGELRFKVELGANGATKGLGRFAECSGLAMEFSVTDYQEGGQNDYVHRLRGPVKFPNLVLKRGVTHEDALLRWLFECRQKTMRRQVTVSLLGPDGRPVRSWAFADAFPVKWTGPNLNAGSNNVASESLEIAHRGFSMQV